MTVFAVPRSTASCRPDLARLNVNRDACSHHCFGQPPVQAIDRGSALK